jgi:hypothetical protein
MYKRIWQLLLASEARLAGTTCVAIGGTPWAQARPRAQHALALRRRHGLSLGGRPLRALALPLPFTCPTAADSFAHAQGRSVVAPTFSTAGQPHILRWNPALPLTFDNVACFDPAEAARHEAGVLRVADGDPDAFWGEATAEVMTRRVAEERALRRWRV